MIIHLVKIECPLYFVSADQVYGDQEMHSEVRRHCMDYMVCAGRLLQVHQTQGLCIWVIDKG